MIKLKKISSKFSLSSISIALSPQIFIFFIKNSPNVLHDYFGTDYSLGGYMCRYGLLAGFL